MAAFSFIHYGSYHLLIAPLSVLFTVATMEWGTVPHTLVGGTTQISPKIASNQLTAQQLPGWGNELQESCWYCLLKSKK
jgi:hypothetical protein